MNLNLKRFSFNSGVSSCAKPSMIPSEGGEYVLYSDVVQHLAWALDQLGHSARALTPVVPCGHPLEIAGTKGRACTYCTLPAGHKGECR